MLVISGSVSWPVTARNDDAIGEIEFRRVRERLEALREEALLAAPFDARRSALAALLAVRVADKEEVQAFLRRLHRGGDFTMERVAELEMLARAVLYILAQRRSSASPSEGMVWDDLLRRAWTLMVPVYGEVRMAETLAGVPEPRRTSRRPTAADRPTMRPMARRHPRINVELEVLLVSEPNIYPGFVENLSEGGVFIATREPLPMGSQLTMMIGLPDGGAPIAVRGEVRWTREPTSEGAPLGMGIRFVDLSFEDGDRIRAFIADRAPILFQE
jgi:uncharacterized protein (TIGR02266 family)